MVSDHDHVLAESGQEGWYECQVEGCEHGLFDFDMPLASDVSDWATKVADVPLQDWQCEFLDRAVAGGWRNPIVPNRRGKRAAYEDMVAAMQAEYGPGEPLRTPDGRVHGHQWLKTATDSLGGVDEAMIARQADIYRRGR